jgi:hypothetical protein
MRAADKGHAATVQLLARAKCDVDVQNSVRIDFNVFQFVAASNNGH